MAAVRLTVTATAPGGGAARVGRLETPHGVVETPAFMPVGTRGTVRGLAPSALRATGARMLLANAYHLALRPGAETVRALGGLHAVMGWDGPILTDSGGYQVFSLAEHREVTEAGVRFKSPVDGARIFLGPREAVAIQEALGSDIAMVLDELVQSDFPLADLTAAAERTTRWAEIALTARTRADQALFGITQGGADAGLRVAHARAIAALPFDGFAIGGLGVGELAPQRDALVRLVAPLLPADKPRYLMGLGEPPDIGAGAAAGVDLFDCVVPTRNGRNAEVFTRGGIVRLRNAVHANDRRPLDAACRCEACTRFSRGALRHLFLADEMLGPILAALHNVTFYQDLMAEIRSAIPSGSLDAVAALAKRATEPEGRQ